jgi:predicted nucleic acid-binding protein
MSTPYLETGFALKRYVQEPNSALAREALLPYSPPLPLTQVLEMEIVNALHGKVHRREMTKEVRDQCLADFYADVLSGFWQRCTLSASNLCQRVLALAGKHTPTLGTRTLDLMHVAAALELGCTDFLSFDQRQRQAAQAEGLKVCP